MFPQKVKFELFARRNLPEFPFALYVKLDDNPEWCIMEWEKKPKQGEIALVKKIFMRSCLIYHRNINPPHYTLQEVA